jgi:hypothetical protein
MISKIDARKAELYVTASIYFNFLSTRIFMISIILPVYRRSAKN